LALRCLPAFIANISHRKRQRLVRLGGIIALPRQAAEFRSFGLGM
jgi:hypothetical protein